MDSNDQISDYRNWIDSLKSKIQSARTKLALSVSTQLIELYWEIGKDISVKSNMAG